MNLKEKIKFAIKHPKKALYHLFSSKEKKALKFFEINYLDVEPKKLFELLKEYWKKYRFLDEITKIIKIDDPSFQEYKILDVGCGYTSFLNILPYSDRYGIDTVINGLKIRNFSLDKDIKWINGNAEELPFEDDFFDIVISSNAFDHYDNPEKALSEIRRVLKPNGYFILTLDIFKKDIGYRNQLHPHSYTEEKLIEKLTHFKIIFKKKSQLNAQFCNFINNNLKFSNNEKELILVLKKNNLSNNMHSKNSQT